MGRDLKEGRGQGRRDEVRSWTRSPSGMGACAGDDARGPPASGGSLSFALDRTFLGCFFASFFCRLRWSCERAPPPPHRCLYFGILSGVLSSLGSLREELLSSLHRSSQLTAAAFLLVVIVVIIMCCVVVIVLSLSVPLRQTGT